MKLFSSLTNRIFVATALLSVLSMGVAIYIVNRAVNRQGERELQRGIEEAAGEQKVFDARWPEQIHQPAVTRS